MVSIKTAKMNAEYYFQSEDLQVKNTCKGANDYHSWRQTEPYYIMSGGDPSQKSRRRVYPIEYSRLNGGKGLRTNTSVTPVLIVQPSKPITNTLIK